MKIRGRLEDILKQKYEEIEIPDDIFNLDEILRDVEPIKKKNNILKYVASFAIAIVAVFSITICILNISDNKTKVDQQAGNVEANVGENVLPTYVDSITIRKKDLTFYENNDIYGIYKIKVEEILDYSTKEEKGICYPITKIKATILNSFKGEKFENIEFWVPGGVWQIKQLKATNLPYKIEGIQEYEEDEYIKIRYYENVTISEPIIGSTYVTMLYKLNNEYYVCKNKEYGFKEYNEENNSVRISDTEWKPLDLSNYIN